LARLFRNVTLAKPGRSEGFGSLCTVAIVTQAIIHKYLATFRCIDDRGNPSRVMISRINVTSCPPRLAALRHLRRNSTKPALNGARHSAASVFYLYCLGLRIGKRGAPWNPYAANNT
jgi:hypothetical protein